MNNRKKILTVLLILVVFVLGGVSVYVALKVSQPAPVAPTAPVSEPAAFIPEEGCVYNGGECTTSAVCSSRNGSSIGQRDCSTGTICCGLPWAACSQVKFDIACKPRPACLDETPACQQSDDESWCPYLSCDVKKRAFSDNTRNISGNYYLEDELSDKETVFKGQTFVYSIPYINKGTIKVDSATVVDELSGNLTYVDSDSGCQYSAVSRKVTCTIGEVAPGGRSQVAIRVKVNTTATVGDLLNKATITSFKGGVAICSNNLTIAEAPKPKLSCVAKRSYDKNGNASVVFAKGEEITYTFSLENSGNQKSTGYLISDTLNGEGRELLTFVSGDGCTYSASTDKVTCAAELDPAEKKNISFVAKISDTAADNRSIRNVGVLSGPLAEGLGISNCATTSAVRNAVIGATKKAYRDSENNSAGNYSLTQEISSVTRNQTYVYTINVQNSGTGEANDVVISDVLISDGQDELEYIDGDERCSYISGSREVKCTVDIDGSSSESVSFRVGVSDDVNNGDIIKNTAVVTLGDQRKEVTKTVTVTGVVTPTATITVTSTPTPTQEVVTPTSTPTPTPTATPTVTVTETPVVTPTLLVTVTPTSLPEAGILDIPGVAVFGGGLLMAVIGILLAL